MFDWMKGIFGRGTRSLALVSPWLQNIVWTMRRTYIELARDAYQNNSVVYACLRLLSTSVAEPPLLAYQLRGTNDLNLLPFDHPLHQLIRNPNPHQTEYEMIEMISLHTAIGGRSVWWKQRKNNGQIKYLWPLRPDRVGPVYAKAKEGSPEAAADPDQPIIEGWAYMPPGQGQPVHLSLDDVCVFSFPDPSGETGGVVEALGPLANLMREIETDNEATNFAAALLKNSATPGLVIKTKQSGITRKEARDIKFRFMTQFGGVRRGEPAVLDGETDIVPLSFNLQQLDFKNLRHVSESRIAAVLGVPAILVGLEVGLESGIRATIAEQREYFAETTLSNLWRRFSDQFTKSIASEFGPNIVCRFNTAQVKALAAQVAQQYQPIMEGFKLGAVTIDEYRVRVLQLPEIGGSVGESLLVSTLTVATPTEEDEGFLTPSEEGDDGEVSAARGKARARRVRTRALKVAARGALALPSESRDASDATVRDALASLFDGLADATATKIRQGVAISDADLSAAFESVLPRLLRDATLAFGLSLAQSYGVSFDPAAIAADADIWITSYVPQLIKGLTETTAKVVTTAVSEYRQTPGITQADLVNALTPAFGAERAEMIAVTEVTRAQTQAITQYQTMLAKSGVTMQARWNTSHDETVCPICAPLGGTGPADWPADAANGPPAHVRCRCFLTLQQEE